MTRPLLLLLLLAGCSAPELTTTPEPAALAAPYPRLAPMGPLLAAGETGTLTDEQIAAIQAEGAAVEARGTALARRAP